MPAPSLTSVGFDGVVDEVAWARLSRYMGAPYAVGGPNDLKVTPVAGLTRTVQIEGGEAFGKGVLDEFEVATLQLPDVPSGVRWDLVAVRRDWQPPGGTSTIDYLTGTSGKSIPAGRLTTPGVEDDQPLALVQCSSTSTVPLDVVDLRLLKGAGGLRGFDELAKAFLPAGEVLRVGSDVWVADVDEVGGVDWRREVPHVVRDREWTIVRGSSRSTDTWDGVGNILSGTIVGAPAGKYLVMCELALMTDSLAAVATSRISVNGQDTSARVDLEQVTGHYTPIATHTHGGGSLPVVVTVTVSGGRSGTVVNAYTRAKVIYLGP